MLFDVVLERYCEQCPFAVMLRMSNSEMHFERPHLGEDRRAGVSFLLSDIPIGRVSRRPELLDVVRMRPGFLQTKDVGIFLSQILEEIFPENRSQAINVPGDQLHRYLNEWQRALRGIHDSMLARMRAVSFGAECKCLLFCRSRAMMTP